MLLPEPKYRVEAYEGARGAHLYRVVKNDVVLADALPSVTRKLDIIGGPKTGALMGWAVKEALRHVEDVLATAHYQNKPITPDLLAEVIKAGRKRPEKIKDAAADLGTRVHGLIDAWIANKDGAITMQEDERAAFLNFLHFVRKKKLKFICGDLSVASVKHKYGGRLDALAVMGNKLVLLDWKTSNGIRDEYALQVAGYRMGLTETYGITADRALVVRFDKVDPKVLDWKEVALGQATRTWKRLVEFESEYYKGVWK